MAYGQIGAPSHRRHGARQIVLTMLALAGLGVGVLPPYLDGAVAGLRAGWASDDVAAALAEARTLAVTRSRLVQVFVDEHLRSVSVEGGRWRRLSDRIALAGPRPDADGLGVIVFRPDGSSPGGQVVVWSHGRAVLVLVDEQTGLVRRVSAGAKPAG